MPIHQQPPITYILPTTAWASLLEVIARDAPPGALIEVHTEAMQRLAERTLAQHGRHDVTLRLRPAGEVRRPDHAA